MMFNLKLPEAGAVPALPSSSGRITISILESQPKPLDDDADEDATPPLNTGEFFSVVVRNGNEVLERYDNLRGCLRSRLDRKKAHSVYAAI